VDKKEKLFYVETGRGCMLILANSIIQARGRALQNVGTYEGVSSVRKATPQDIAWVEAMGGFNPIKALAEEVVEKR
jgi:ribosomal protein S16